MCRDECFLQSKVETMMYAKMLLQLSWKDGLRQLCFQINSY